MIRSISTSNSQGNSMIRSHYLAVLVALSGLPLVGCGKKNAADGPALRQSAEQTKAPVATTQPTMTLQEKLKKFKLGLKKKVDSYIEESNRSSDSFEQEQKKEGKASSDEVNAMSRELSVLGNGGGITYREIKKTDNVEFGYSVVLDYKFRGPGMDIENASFEFPVDDDFNWSGNYKKKNLNLNNVFDYKIVNAFKAGLDEIK